MPGATTPAEQLRDTIVQHITTSSFGAHGLHVRLPCSVASHRFIDTDERAEIHSVSKAMCVLAAGIASDEGLVSLSDRIVDLLPASYLSNINLGEGVKDVTLRHLLSMTSGIDLPWSKDMMTDYLDLAAEFLSRPCRRKDIDTEGGGGDLGAGEGEGDRGRVYQYSNASTYTAMHALSYRTGDLEAFVRSRLFEPLGIHGVEWRRCPNGRVLAGEGIALTTEEMARVGKLIRDRGVWDGTDDGNGGKGKRIVSAGIVDAMHSDWVDTGSKYKGYGRYALSGWGIDLDIPSASEAETTAADTTPSPDSDNARGADARKKRLAREAWRLHGAYGQLIIFAGNAVVTITADDHPGADGVAVFVAEAAIEMAVGTPQGGSAAQ